MISGNFTLYKRIGKYTFPGNFWVFQAVFTIMAGISEVLGRYDLLNELPHKCGAKMWHIQAKWGQSGECNICIFFFFFKYSCTLFSRKPKKIDLLFPGIQVVEGFASQEKIFFFSLVWQSVIFYLFHKALNILFFFFFQKSFQMFTVPCAFIFIIFHQANHKNHKGNYSYSIILKYRSVIQENHREIQRYKKIIEKYRDTRKS